MLEPGWILVAIGAAVAVIAGIWWPVRAASREARFAATRRDFHAQRERLEAKFVRLAFARGRPNGPHWPDCEFDDDVAYLRNRRTGELSAFVGVSVAVDQRGGLGPDTGDPGGRVRFGTAVFRFDRDHWDTEGRAILNVSPAEAIRLYQHDLKVIDRELAQRS